MNDHDAPTSFIVWIEKRLEKTLSLIVLLISEKEMNVSNAANTSSTMLIFLRLAFTWSMKSFW